MDGYLATHEVYIFVFDALPVFLSLCIYSVLHFSIFLPSSSQLSDDKPVEMAESAFTTSSSEKVKGVSMI